MKAGRVLVRNAKLVDAGLEAMRRVVENPQSGRFIGTPGYMSPEQINMTQLTPATDVFALGIVAYELAYHELPFRGGSSVDRLVATLTGHVVQPAAENVPASVRDVIELAMTKEPTQRFVSAEAFGTAIDASLRDLTSERYDVFISHAAEDKDAVARPLAELLARHGIRVWYDEFSLRLGDSLNRSINAGIAASRYGIVILSPRFFAKQWPQRELDGLVAREVDGHKVILPLWHEITVDQIARHSPILADRLAIGTDRELSSIVDAVVEVIRTGR